MGINAAKEFAAGNDVQVIREILFGEQYQHITERFARLEESIASLQKENQQLRQALEKEEKARQQAIAELERATDTRFQQLLQEHAQQVESIQEKHRLDMSRLVSLLASALADYQGQTE